MAAITGPSLGYAGSVTETTGRDYFNRIGSSKYGVVGADDLKVSVTTGDRMLLVGAGTAWGHNIMDTLGVSVSVQLDAVASGSRWDMVVLRRDVTARTTVEVVKGTASLVLPSLTTSSASHPDQPLALVRVMAGQTTVQEIIDLRCWAGPGGVVIADAMALSYLDTPGTTVHHGRDTWVRTVGQTGASWIRGRLKHQIFTRGVTMTIPRTIGTGTEWTNVSFPSGLFDPSFSDSPNVQLTMTNKTGYGRLSYQTQNVTHSGFSIGVYRSELAETIPANITLTFHVLATQ